jgi:hypothetical protein
MSSQQNLRRRELDPRAGVAFDRYHHRMTSLFRLGLLLIATVLAAPVLSAQELTGAARSQFIATANPQYYNLRSAGAKGFTCNVDVDWDALFTSINGKPLTPAGSMMTYLTASHLSLHADLTGGKSTSAWANSGTPSENIQKSADSIRDGIRQTLDGFLEAWLPSLNGTLITAAPASIKAAGEGFVIDDGTAAETDEITLDKNYVATKLYNKSDKLIADMIPAFSPTPKGLILTKLDASYHQPPSAPATHVIMSATFQPVDTFQLPGALIFTVDNVATFKMSLSGCIVQKQP